MIQLTVDPKVYNLPGDHVEKLRLGKITPGEFVRHIKKEDPIKLKGNTIQYISPEETKKTIQAFKDKQKATITAQGGLEGKLLYTHRAEIMKVYPEMVPIFEELEKQVAKEKCRGCALKRKTKFLTGELLKFKSSGRDLKPLESKLGTQAIRFLMDRDSIKIVEDDLAVPLYLTKRMEAAQKVEQAQKEEPVALPKVDSIEEAQTRDACLDCVTKHISAALVCLARKDSKSVTRAWAHLKEAAEEIEAEDNEIYTELCSIAETLIVL